MIKIQLSQLARTFDAIDAVVKTNQSQTVQLHNWIQVRTFIVKYDHGYLYNSLNGALGATVLLAVGGLAMAIFKILPMSANKLEKNYFVLNDTANLMTVIMCTFAGLIGSITSWVYLTYLNQIELWHKELISSVKLRQLDIEYSLKNTLSSDSTLKHESNVDDDVSTILNPDQTDLPSCFPSNEAFQSTFGVNKHLSLSSTNHYNDDIVGIYAAIINELTCHHYPPTLYGFDYRPSMLTALKGYIFFAIGLTGYLAYAEL